MYLESSKIIRVSSVFFILIELGAQWEGTTESKEGNNSGDNTNVPSSFHGSGEFLLDGGHTDLLWSIPEVLGCEEKRSGAETLAFEVGFEDRNLRETLILDPLFEFGILFIVSVYSLGKNIFIALLESIEALIFLSTWKTFEWHEVSLTSLSIIVSILIRFGVECSSISCPQMIIIKSERISFVAIIIFIIARASVCAH